MTNLIIAILTIILVAIAAIMGVLYFSNSYTSWQASALASQILNNMNQIASAANFWRTDHFVKNAPDSSDCGSSICNFISTSSKWCWGEVLYNYRNFSNGKAYLVNMQNWTTWCNSGAIITVVSLGNYDPLSSNGSEIVVTSDTGIAGDSSQQYVEWTSANASSGGNYPNSLGVTGPQASQYLALICTALNKALGAYPYSAGTVMNTTLGVPYYSTAAAAPYNTCFTSNQTGAATSGMSLKISF